MARRLKGAGRVSIGLVGLEPSIPVLELAREMGEALVALGDRVALVGPAPSWPEPGGGPGGQEPVISHQPDCAVEVLPRRVPPARVSAAIEQTLVMLRPKFDRILVDLSGLAVLAEQAAALATVGGVALIGRVGTATEIEAARFRGPVAPGRLLGVILID
jgi:hypothetical protein